MSAITMIGSPAEYYVYGSTYGWLMVADLIGILFAAFVYLPIYWDLTRVSKRVRKKIVSKNLDPLL